VRAATHTEVYRPFRGQALRHPLRALVLAWSGVRVGFRRKLPALLLFAMPAIMTIVLAFVINLKFDTKNMMEGMFDTRGGRADVTPFERIQAERLSQAMAGAIAGVESLVFQFVQRMRFFVILVMGWYGSGLIAEDRRLRANLLYFARPLSRWTYLRGKLGTAAFWGSCVVVLPVTILLGVASFASPDWTFFTERWPVILKFIGYALAYVLVHALLVLAVSSVADRRNRALAGVFGIYILTSLGGESMTRLFDGQEWRLVSLPRNFERIAEWLFGIRSGAVEWPLEASFWAIGFYVLASGLVLAHQLKKMERGL